MMTREENICQSCAHSKVCKFNDGESSEYCNQHLALTALRPVSREMVEKVWRGEWIVGEPNGLGFPIHCSRCGWGTDHTDPRKWMDYGGHIFCGHCGAPMTDEAVEMVMERMEKLYEQTSN